MVAPRSGSHDRSMSILHDLATELAGNGTASTAAAIFGILLVTAIVAATVLLMMVRVDADPRSHPHHPHRPRHLARH